MRLLVQSALRYRSDGLLERAPGMAYYGILSLFPMFLIAFSLLRFVGGADLPQELSGYARDEGASGALADAIRSAAQTARSASGETAGTAGLVGAATVIYGASRAFTAAGRALDAIAGGGPVATSRALPRRAQDLGWTLVVLVMAGLVLLLTLASGDVLTDLAGLVGIKGELLSRLARAAALVVTGLLTVAVVRWSAPSPPRPPFRLVTPGAGLTVISLLVASVAFDVYVTSIASYNDTYGAFTGAIVLMLWMWLAASTFLLGAELDAVLAAERPGIAPPAG